MFSGYRNLKQRLCFLLLPGVKMHRHRSIISTLFDKSEERKVLICLRNLCTHLCIYVPRSNFLLHLNIMASCSGCFFNKTTSSFFLLSYITRSIFRNVMVSSISTTIQHRSYISKHRRYSLFLDRTQIYKYTNTMNYISPLPVHPMHLCHYTQPLPLHPTFAITFHVCYYTQPLPLHIVFLFYFIISFLQVFYFCTVLYARKT